MSEEKENSPELEHSPDHEVSPPAFEEAQEDSSAEPTSPHEGEKNLQVPSGAMAEIRRKAREKYLTEGIELGRKEALQMIQREYEAALNSKAEVNAPPPSPQANFQRGYTPSFEELNEVENRGLSKYDNFEEVVLERVKRDSFSKQVAQQIATEYRTNTEDVLQKVFSDPKFLSDLKTRHPLYWQDFIRDYIYTQPIQKPKPVSRPPNPPLSEVKSSLNTGIGKDLSLSQKIALYRKSKGY